MTDNQITNLLEKINNLLDNTNNRIDSIENDINYIKDKISYIENNIKHTKNKSDNFDSLSLTLPKQKHNDVINFAVILHSAETIDSIKSVILRMSSDERFNLTIFSCNRRYPGSPRFIDEDKIHNYLETHNIKHIRLNTDSKTNLELIKATMPDGIIRQSQWDADLPPELSTQSIKFAKIYFIPYEIMNFIPGVHEDETNSYFHRSCNLIFLANRYMTKEEKTYSNRVVAGHPKVKELINANEYWPIKGEFKLKIIWGAHHSITHGWSNFGTFLNTYKDMLELAKNNKDISIVFHPHPGLITMLNNSGGHNKNIFDNFKQEWEALDNTLYSTYTTYAEYFKASDLLVTDGISWLLEYQTQKKPIIFIERKDHRAFDEHGEFIATGVYRIDSASEAVKIIIDFKNGKVHDKKENQEIICNKYLTIDDYQNTDIKIVNLIYNDIKESCRK